MSETAKLRVRISQNDIKRSVTAESPKRRHKSFDLEAAYRQGVAKMVGEKITSTPPKIANDIYKTTFQVKNDAPKIAKKLPQKHSSIAAPIQKALPRPKKIFKPMSFLIVNDRCK